MTKPFGTLGVQYLPVPDFPAYMVGDDGTIWSCWRIGKRGKGRGRGCAKVMSDTFSQLHYKPKENGYFLISLSSPPQKRRAVNLHRLVLEVFRGPAPTGHQCCHNDGNPFNNKLSNLRWGTAKENGNDKVRHGTSVRGEKQAAAKLTADKAATIKRLLAVGLDIPSIARQFSVNPAAIRAIQHGRNWSWV